MSNAYISLLESERLYKAAYGLYCKVFIRQQYDSNLGTLPLFSVTISEW